jgi:hypothetical protein
MASTYSNLKIELIGTGDQSGTWGNTTNINLGTAIEEAITGSADVPFSSADVTLTLTDTNGTQTARNLRLNLTGTSGGARNLIVPAIEKQYIINNGLADAVTVKNSTGTGVAVPAGKSMIVFNTGSNVVETATALGTSIVVPVANGGTGLTSYTTGDIIYASASGTLSQLADVATGNALISGGVGVAPSYGKIGLTTHVSGTLPIANGGTNSTSTTYCSLTANVTGTLPVANGGTGATTQTAYSVLCGGTTSTGAYQSVASLGTAGQVLTSNGAGALPTWSSAASGTVTSVGWTGGIVSVATATTTPAFTIAGTSGGIPYFSSGTTWASSAALAASALVIGGGAGGAPSTTTTGTGVLTALGIAVNTGSGGLVTNTGTATLTNKRITPRALTLTSTSGAITPDSDTYDQVNYSLTGSSSFSNPSGAPTNGQKLIIRLYAASTQTISSWSSTTNGYRAIGTTLPTSVPAGKTIYVGCIWNLTDSKWDVLGVATQA